MKRPSVLDVATVLRNNKLIDSELNTKSIKDWNKDDYSEWGSITGQGPHYERPIKEEAKERIRKPCPNTKKVIRIIDGHVFNSISECRRKEGFHKMKMGELLIKGNEYKTI